MKNEKKGAIPCDKSPGKEVSMRLDKYLTECTDLSRKQAKKAIADKRVHVNGELVLLPDRKVGEEDKIEFDHQVLGYSEYEYYMLNKPKGVVSATKDNRDATVVELLGDISKKDLFPIGRLDKDTEGLLILTNDGALAHRLLSPKYHVDKMYYVEVDKSLTKEDVLAFENGMDIGEKKMTLPAKLEILTESSANVTIREGKFHQIKRMFLHQKKTVTYLKRISMGQVILDDNLQVGEFRPLTDYEIEALKGIE